MNWQPIETYQAIPDDIGPEVLLYVPHRNARTGELREGGYICTGHATWFDYSYENNSAPSFYDGDWDIKPSHWMPLPLAPNESSIEETL